ncbi:hypothetical protein D3C84_1235100 [compost metagenome]
MQHARVKGLEVSGKIATNSSSRALEKLVQDNCEWDVLTCVCIVIGQMEGMSASADG